MSRSVGTCVLIGDSTCRVMAVCSFFLCYFGNNVFYFLCPLQIWDSATGKLVHTYDEHSEQVNCCHFTNKSNHLLLATGSSDFFLKVSVAMKMTQMTL